MTVKNALLLAAAVLVLAWLLVMGVAGDVLADTTGDRLMGAINGVVLAVVGNLIPKNIESRSDRRADPARTLALRRLAGWTFTLAGIGYVAVQLTFPIELVRPVSIGLVAGALAVVIAACLLTGRGSQAPVDS